jgi:hypothetical protein
MTGGTGGGESGGSAGSSGASSATGGAGGDGAGGTGGTAGSGDPGAGTGGTDAKARDCDLRKITCKRAQPPCEGMTVPEVQGNCYGECVPIGECGCTEAADCPFEESYTCWRSAMRCGPYVN